MPGRAVYRRETLCFLNEKRCFARRLGYVQQPDGRLTSRRFLLSRDQATATYQNARLEALWAWLVDRHADARQRYRLAREATALQLPTTDRDVADDFPTRPTWNVAYDIITAHAAEVAEAIRTERVEIAYTARGIGGVQTELVPPTDSDWARGLHELNAAYGRFGVRFVPTDEAAAARGRENYALVATKRQQQAVTAARVAQAPQLAAAMTTHEAADRYLAMVRSEPPSQHNQREVVRALRVKESLPDVPLDEFNYDALQALGARWRKRPPSRCRSTRGKPMSVTSVINYVKTARRMLDWWDASDATPWHAPKRWQKALKVSAPSIMTEDERLDRSRGPATWTIAELSTLYRIATDWERALLLMQINLGYAQSEVESWRWCDTDLDASPPQVRRHRRKTVGYFEAALWPQTLRMVAWLRQWSANSPWVVLSPRGNRPTAGKLAASWNKLLDRAQAYQPGFRRLSFKAGRKTAFTLVESVSTREIAGIFEGRGQVTSDRFADAYGARPFERVREANLRVAALLQPVFDTVPHAFTKPWVAGGPNLPRRKLEHIDSLWRQGVSPAEIARLTGVSDTTVHRRRPRDVA